MGGSEDEGIFSGHQSTKEGGVSLLCIRKFLGGRGFLEGSEGEGNFSGHQFTKEGGVSLLCIRDITWSVGVWVGGGREDFSSGHQFTEEGEVHSSAPGSLLVEEFSGWDEGWFVSLSLFL